MVEEFMVEDMILILCGIKEKYELYYGVCILDLVLVVVVMLLYCYIIDWFLLDKVIDFVDEVGS